MLENIHWLGQSAFYIVGTAGTIIYFDPAKINSGLPKADIILISHDHYDHCSAEDLEKILKPGTVIYGPHSVARKLAAYQIKILKSGEKTSFKDIAIEAVCAYNTNKEFHPKSAGNLGFIVTIDNTRIYHAGDTDLIPEMKEIKADIALLPAGGTYTMNAKEAAEAANLINPGLAIPMHLLDSRGSARETDDFKKLCKVKVKILKQE
jgi:L-ascorbate metabolism protein UlaG (beta-lactamase superfamily)